jgi:transposase
MIPPLSRRCPECGHMGSSEQFGVVPLEGGRRRLECPACECRFDPPDDGWRN